MLQQQGKKAKSYAHLQKNLMGKLDEIAVPDIRPCEVDELGFFVSEQLYNNQHNNASRLLQRAKHITEKNQTKIVQARRSLQAQQRKNTFLTGINVYSNKQQKQQSPPPTVHIAPTNLLHEVVSMQTDDLEQLERMIKETGFRLNNYGRDLGKTRSRVSDAAGKFGKYMGSRVASNIDKYPELLPKLSEKSVGKKKFNSTTRAKFSKFM